MRTLREIAEIVGGRVVGPGDVVIHGMAGVDEAGPGDITFVSNPRYEPWIERSRAAAVIVAPGGERGRGSFLVCPNPYLTFARVAALFGEAPPTPRPGTDPLARVSPSARLGRDASVGPFVTVSEGCVVGDRVVLSPGTFLGRGVEIGDDAFLHPNVCVYHGCRVGRRTILHANVAIGSDGFGFAPDGERYEPIPQRGIAIVGDDVSVGANSVVNRGALRDTVIGEGCKIDSCCVISHGVRMGPHCLLVSQVGVSGTATLGRHVTLAGQVGVGGHLTLGDNVRVGGKSAVLKSLPEEGDYLGIPARPLEETQRARAAGVRLPRMREELRDLRRRVDELERLLRGERRTSGD